MYEPSKPAKEAEVRKSLSQMLLEEKKTKRSSFKNLSKKKAVSVVVDEGTSLQKSNERVDTKNEGIIC